MGWGAQRARGNEINTDRRSNALLTCQFAVFRIANQNYRKYQKNLARSTRLVELSSPVSPETLTVSTEAGQLRPKRPFCGNEFIDIV